MFRSMFSTENVDRDFYQTAFPTLKLSRVPTAIKLGGGGGIKRRPFLRLPLPINRIFYRINAFLWLYNVPKSRTKKLYTFTCVVRRAKRNYYLNIVNAVYVFWMLSRKYCKRRTIAQLIKPYRDPVHL